MEARRGDSDADARQRPCRQRYPSVGCAPSGSFSSYNLPVQTGFLVPAPLRPSAPVVPIWAHGAAAAGDWTSAVHRSQPGIVHLSGPQRPSHPISAPYERSRSGRGDGLLPLPRNAPIYFRPPAAAVPAVKIKSCIKQGPSSNSILVSATTEAYSAEPAASRVKEHMECIVAPSSNSVHTGRPTKTGSLGKKIIVSTNHFLVDLTNSKRVYHYKLIMMAPDGEPISKSMARMIEREFVEQFRAELDGRLPVYDGSHALYTAGPLPFESFECTVHFSAENNKCSKAFQLEIRLVASRPYGALMDYLQACSSTTALPQDTLQALSIVFRENPSRYLTTVGKYFFSKGFHEASMGRSTLTAWSGFSPSLRPTQQGLAYVVDISTMTFCKSIPVIDFLKGQVKGFNPDKEMSPRLWECVRKALDKLKVEVTHHKSQRRYKITGLSQGKTEDLVFSYHNGGIMKAAVEKTIVQYFKEAYDYTVCYKKLPCLQMKAGRTTYLPMEVCRISEGEKFRGKLSTAEKQRLRDLTNMEPRKREEIIKTIMDHEHGPAKGEFLREFGVGVSTEPTLVEARQLPPPTLRYGGAGVVSEITPDCDAGKWSMTEMGAQVVEGCIVSEWAMVSFDSHNTSVEEMRAFACKLREMCMEMGVWMSENFAVEPVSCSRDYLATPKRLEQVLRSIKDKSKQPLQLLICLMGEKHRSYGTIKKYCEVELGVVSQCCLSANVIKNASSQLLANIALKINAKLGGCNVALARDIPQLFSVLDKPTIIFGADVSHPSSKDDKSPSIAAVVASSDWPSPTRYVARMRAQECRSETIKDLAEMVTELWQNFREKSNQVPERVLFFRDGVGEGQFPCVLAKELKMLKQALSEVGGEAYTPKITLVVVQKRHNTRLFPTHHDDDRRQDHHSCQQSLNNNVTHGAHHINNILPGTVVDTTITHPTDHLDFYLCSHAGERGTSKPAHYHVLWDEIGFQSDDLQKLIYHLCYTYARCTRSVSIVPPAYYAHLAALRARYYLAAQCPNLNYSKSVVPSLPNIHHKVKDVMYYS